MLNKVEKVQESDTTMLHSSTEADHTIIDLSTKPQNYGLRRRYQNIPVK